MKKLVLILIPFLSFAQTLVINDPYLKINAAPDAPLFTTYTAAMERSRLYGDKGYKMDYYSGSSPVSYSGDQAGSLYNIWKINDVVIMNSGEYFSSPVVIASFPDMAITEYEPVRGVKVQESFFVYSSSLAIINLEVFNSDNINHTVEVYSILESENDSLLIRHYDKTNSSYITEHHESRYRLISSLYKNAPYPEDCRDIFSCNLKPFSFGGYSTNIEEFYNTIKKDYYAENRSDSLNMAENGLVNFISLHFKFEIKPGQQKNLRIFRGWQDIKENPDLLYSEINKLRNVSLQPFVENNQKLFAGIPRPEFINAENKILYLSGFNLIRGCMLPPADSAKYNFYVFSREPLWGWGHGHQVLHESLSMIAYAMLDPISAQNSQRVYISQQRNDGLIAYRHGPRGMQDYPHFSKFTGKEMSTTSAPFFNYINYEIFKVSKDKNFLKEAYNSGVKYANWLIENRDNDNDGTFEWGPYGIIENVRDWYNAVFQVSAERYLDVDKEDISDELECLDLSLMMVKEMNSLSLMAEELGLPDEVTLWKSKSDELIILINKIMWDDSSSFYYSVNRDDHSFKFKTRDLRRMEIIGFLALWAEAAPKDRAELLINHLVNPEKFWRKYGIPTLAADDEWYSPHVDYCCKWNGPVWLLWNYLVIEGLRNYDQHSIADELSDKLINAVKVQLKKNHNFWESYSPDYEILNSPTNYIWDSIISKILFDRYK